MLRRLFGKESKPAQATALGREFEVGDVLEQRFEIEHIRMGFMGIVYIAHDRQRRHRVVLKTFQNKFLWNEDAITRFRAEAELWMRLGSHPNIVRAYDLRTFVGKPHVVAEYVGGGPLRALVGHLTLQEALDASIQICWGMSYAVEKLGIMHCDLKPDNVLVTYEGQAKVTDFGLARALPAPLPEAQTLRMRTAVTEVLSGTLPYMAPERLERLTHTNPEGVWSDIYAFGVTLFELLTGALPFDSPRAESLIRMHTSRPPPDPCALVPQLPPSIAALALRCMAKHPNDRYASFDAIERDLQRVRVQLFGAPYAAPPDEQPTDRDRLMERGQAHIDFGEYSQAAACFKRAVELDTAQPESWLSLARAYLKLWQYTEALATVEAGLRQAASRNDFGLFYLVRGEIYVGMQRPREAVEAFDKGLSYTPDAPALWREKGALLLRMGMAREARHLLEQALTFDTLDPQLWRLLGDVCLAQAQTKPAHRAYGEALKLDPRSAYGWARYGRCQLALGNPREALGSFEAALTLDPALQEALEGVQKAKGKR